MRRIALVMTTAAVLTATLSAQKTTNVHPGKGGSPHVRSEWTVDGANISIEYGRPSLKGRAESQVMPPGKPWRTGADEATTVTSDKPLKFGTLTVPAGTHTLNTVPGADGWQLIVGKLQKPGQWGIPYSGEAQDLGRVPMTVEKAASSAEQLTISVDDTAAGGTLKVSWGTSTASVPFTVG